MTDEQRQVLIEALRSGRGPRTDRTAKTLLESALSRTQLAPEQAAIFDLLLSLQDDDAGSRSSHEDEDDHEDDGDAHAEPSELADLRQELADLREANDTVAAALGACRFCWGGDDDCRACHGRGRAGHLAPDPRLFAELVVPAVTRMRARERPARAGRATRPTVEPSTTRKDRT